MWLEYSPSREDQAPNLGCTQNSDDWKSQRPDPSSHSSTRNHTVSHYHRPWWRTCYIALMWHHFKKRLPVNALCCILCPAELLWDVFISLLCLCTMYSTKSVRNFDLDFSNIPNRDAHSQLCTNQFFLASASQHLHSTFVWLSTRSSHRLVNIYFHWRLGNFF